MTLSPDQRHARARLAAARNAAKDEANEAAIEKLLAAAPKMTREKVDTMNRLFYSHMGVMIDWAKYSKIGGECPHCHREFENVARHVASWHS